jgi:phytoene synthase
MSTLASDYAACAALLRRSASNFALPILLLPAAKRHGTTALYAFCRKADDLVDDQTDLTAARRSLDDFATDVAAALAGGATNDPVLRALVDTVRRFGVPAAHLHAIIDGVRMDLDHQAYDTFAELRGYCERVASAVGRAAIHIWGFRGDRAFAAADACGLAFQLTNILRDIPEDLSRGRIYLPAAELAACGCDVEDLRAGRIHAGFAQLASREVARAEAFYDQARPLDACLSTDGRIVFRAMFGVYRALLDAVRSAGPVIFTAKVRPHATSLLGRGLATMMLGTRPWRLL